MKKQNHNSKAKESSVQFMLAEYSRIKESELHNRSSGETRFNIYLTLVSVSFAGAWTFWGTVNKQSADEIKQFYFVSIVISMFLFFTGWQTFYLFISRWQSTVIYLRKLARIRKWFLSLDSSLQNGLTYSTDEKKPSFLSKSFFSSSLLTLVVMLNCTFLTFTVLLIILLTVANLIPNILIITIGIIIFLLTLWMQYQSYKKHITKLEKDDFVAFPKPHKK